MTIHVLVACSKSKSHAAPEDLTWGEGVSLESWRSSWEEANRPRYEAMDLYSGRATRRQLQLSSDDPNSVPYLISAGAGLVRVSDGIKIPSYESTFGKGGPSFEDWHLLPHGGLSNLELADGDMVLAFAPPSYLRAISRDPGLGLVSRHLVAPSHSCLGGVCSFPVRVHPRIKEVLGVASADLNTELIRMFMESGKRGIEMASRKADALPPPPVRRRVSDEELLEMVRSKGGGRKGMDLVRHIRDELGISASVERIGMARRIRDSESTTDE